MNCFLGTPEGIFIASLRSLRLGKRSTGAFGFGFASLPSLFKTLPQIKNKEERRSCDTLLYGTPEGIRTPDLLVRSQTLYPAELPAHFLLPEYIITKNSKNQHQISKKRSFGDFYFSKPFIRIVGLPSALD